MQVGVLFLYKYKLCKKHVLLTKSFTWLVLRFLEQKKQELRC